jgi:hypothetical protein
LLKYPVARKNIAIAVASSIAMDAQIHPLLHQSPRKPKITPATSIRRREPYITPKLALESSRIALKRSRVRSRCARKRALADPPWANRKPDAPRMCRNTNQRYNMTASPFRECELRLASPLKRAL